MKRLSLLGMFALLFGMGTLVGCPKDDGDEGGQSVEDAGTEGGADAGSDAGEDAGFDAGFKCRIDDDCEVFDQGLRCDYATAECVPAKPCNDNSNCAESLQGAEYCQGQGCRCVQEGTKDGGTSVGVCRRRRAVCEECTDDTQCGTGPTFDTVGACKALPGDSSGKKYCFQQQKGPSCECGYVNDGTGYCRPQSNTCSGTGCGADTDCPAGGVCNVAMCVCEPRCRWDFQSKTEVPPCGPGRSCWVDQVNLNPTSKFYGAGRCRPACGDDGACTDTVSNPFGGADLVCQSEETPSGPSAKRCRPDGECMDSYQCTTVETDAPSKGYCDRSDRTCKTDCRIGNDPVTGLPFSDCRPGFACEQRGAVRECVKQACAQLGGANLACPSFRQLCCGEDWNGNGTSVDDACGSAPQDENRCFFGDKATFCKPCADNSECAGVKGPSNSSLPSLCWPYQDQATGATAQVCAVSTLNDFTVDGIGVSKASHGCPSGTSVTEVLLNRNAAFDPQNDPDRCKADSDCGANGLCGENPAAQKKPDGTRPKVCLCTDSGKTCPGAENGMAGGVCRSGNGNRACLESVVCVARPEIVFGTDAATGGCASP